MRIHGVLRVVVVVLALSLTLVLLPIAINIGTGGTAPPILERYARWTWPTIGLLWLAAIFTGLWEYRSRRTVTHSARSADQPRNRPNALARIDRYLGDRFTGSLAARTRLALALDESPDAVDRPYDLLVQPLDSAVAEIREDADIATVFDDLQDSMLILGAPGAGKTTLLLDLARSLAAQAHSDPDQPIPVLVDLAGWNGPVISRREDDDPDDSALLAGFVRWLLGELGSRYQIPAAVGRIWLREGRLALLLDGMDEIARAHRDRLATALEELQQHYRVGQLAVTCRSQDYDRLDQLRLYGAVRIRPLSRQQVLDYFAQVGPELAGARAAIEQDDDLWDLINSPLMLNVVALAYQGRDAAELAAGAVADHRRELFDTYISEVLARYRPTSPKYNSKTVLRSLWCIARWTRMGEGDRIMLPRRLPPGGWYGTVLPEVSRLAHLVCLPALFAGFVGGVALAAAALFGLVAGLAAGGIGLVLIQLRPTWRVFRQRPEQPPVPIAAIVICSSAAVGFGVTLAGAGIAAVLPIWLGLTALVGGVGAAYLYEIARLGDPADRPRRRLIQVRFVAVALLGALAFARAGSPSEMIQAVVVGVIGAEGVRLIARLPMDQLKPRDRAIEYVDGPRFRWRMVPWVASTVAGCVLVAAALGAEASLGLDPLLGLLLGTLAAQGWELFGHRAAETVSRLLHGLPLRWAGYLPWRRRAFLQYTADRHVLARAGEGSRLYGEQYAFIHLLVRDHLADCDPDELAAKVDRRIAARAARSSQSVGS